MCHPRAFVSAFGNVAIFTNSSTLISKSLLPSLILVLRWCFGANKEFSFL